MDCDIIECLTNTNLMEETQNWYTLKAYSSNTTWELTIQLS